MLKMKFANRMAAIASALLCVFGIIITLMLLVGAAKARPFDWYRFIPALLYILCFASLIAYSMVSLVPSKVAFPAVLATYGLVVLVTGIIDNAPQLVEEPFDRFALSDDVVEFDVADKFARAFVLRVERILRRDVRVRFVEFFERGDAGRAAP